MVQDSTVKDGEERVAAVYRDHHKKMWRALFSFAGDPDIASDAMAEAFARALRDQYTIRDLTAWTWRVAFRIATCSEHWARPRLICVQGGSR
jgi:DNA-directed RNA polymerase specialized sigma24 family protein